MDIFALLLYIGPDQILPLTSLLGAVVGFLLLLWQRIVGWARTALHFLVRNRKNPESGSKDV